MIQTITNILNGIGDFFVNIGNIISDIYKGMIEALGILKSFFNYIGSFFNTQSSVLAWALGADIIAIFVVVFAIVIYLRIMRFVN